MPFSVELFFDPKSSMAVQQCGTSLEKAGVPAIFSTLGATPHVSLAVFEQYNPERLHALLKKLASSFPPTDFRLSSLGTFPGKEGVLFLAPVVTASLLEIHSWLHRALPKAVEESWIYYDPGCWVPHCTLSLRLTPKKMAKGVELLRRKGFAIRGRYNHLALVETQ
ncbi:MAG TPA: 2'-5' RNA ligase family protein, partial [bacterium]|nr:2'-5' RNA ligase family protein [bacterium]